MKKIIKFLSITILFIFFINVKADYKVNFNELNNIREYDNYNDFIIDYKNNLLPNIYITNFLFDGVSTVKSMDLDKPVEEIKVRVLNINSVGNYELTGTFKGMVAINTNNIKGEINIILNGVNINTDTKKVPAIYIYNKNINYLDCKVTIKPHGIDNYIEGGRLKKVSLMPSNELNKYEDYYSKKNIDNYKNNPNYYGVYTNKELENILFAKVEADKKGLKDGDPYYFYKASGVISSDIDLSFNGDGYLKVVSKNNEGIESKANMSFLGGKGDYEIISYEDALNTTTERVDDNTRNDILIDVNSLVARINLESDEGDAIDSNGKLIINGGNIYAFAHPTSEDTGLDSPIGIYLNGGTILATGNKADEIDDSSQKYMYIKLDDSIEDDSLVVIKDQDNKIIFAYKTDRSYKTLLYSSSNLDYKSYKVYIGGEIKGKETNGLYTKIDSYRGGKLIYSSDGNQDNNEPINSTDKTIVIYISILVIVIIGFIISSYINSKKEKDFY